MRTPYFRIARFLTSRVSAVSNTKIGSIGGLHKSMTKLSSNQLNCQPPLQPVHLSCQNAQSQLTGNRAIVSNGYLHQYSINAPSNKIYCGGVTVTTRDSSPTKSILWVYGSQSSVAVNAECKCTSHFSGSASALRDDGVPSVVRHSIPNYCSIQTSHDPSSKLLTIPHHGAF